MARMKEFDPDEVLDRAVDLFSSRGYHAASMQEVVSALGLSRSSLYDTFTDKQELYQRALERYRQCATRRMVALLDASTDVRATIATLFDQLIAESQPGTQGRGCLMVNSAVELGLQDPAIAELVNRNAREMEDAFCRALERGQASGQIASHQPARSLARHLYNTISGLRVAAKSGTAPDVLRDIVQVAMSVL